MGNFNGHNFKHFAFCPATHFRAYTLPITQIIGGILFAVSYEVEEKFDGSDYDPFSGKSGHLYDCCQYLSAFTDRRKIHFTPFLPLHLKISDGKQTKHEARSEGSLRMPSFYEFWQIDRNIS